MALYHISVWSHSANESLPYLDLTLTSQLSARQQFVEVAKWLSETLTIPVPVGSWQEANTGSTPMLTFRNEVA